MAQAPLTTRRWKRVEYDRLVDLGMFEDEPLELIGGELIVAEPKGAYHSAAVTAVDYALRAALPPGWIVRTQQPLLLDDESEPEPDLAVVPGRPGDYRDAHPERPALAIEVAHSSLYFDREHKGSLYARAGSKTTGSSTSSIASSRSIAIQAPTPRRSTAGDIDLSRPWRRLRASCRSPSLRATSPSRICCPDSGGAVGAIDQIAPSARSFAMSSFE